MSRFLPAATKTDHKRAKVLYFIIVAGLASAGIALFYEARQVLDAGIRVEQATEVEHSAHRVLRALQDAETGQRGYLLTGDDKYLTPYRRGVGDLGDAMVDLTQAAGKDQKSLTLIRDIANLKNKKLDELASTVELTRTGNSAAAVLIVQSDAGEEYMGRLRTDLDSLTKHWRHEAAVRHAASDATLRAGTVALVFFMGFVGALVSYAYFITRREFRRIHSHSESLNHDATHDTLTGLPNRRKLFNDLAMLATIPGVATHRVALLYLDIDGFKGINDSLGHSAGDALLREIAGELRAVTREQDTLARVGGDEFILLAPDFGTDAQLGQIGQRLIQRIETVARKRHGPQCQVSASIGIATYPDKVPELGMLADSADAAMYRAKQNGRRQVVFSHAAGKSEPNILRFARKQINA